MTVRIRADLDQLPRYVAGRTVPGAIKLASNEVSAGPLPSVVEAIHHATDQVHRYPDMGVSKLTDALSARLDVAPERIAVGCGSVAVCQQIIQATCTSQHEVVFPWRSFEAYPILTRIVGAQAVQVPLTSEHAINLDALAAAITPATRVIFVCTPNNPTGTWLRQAELERFLAAVPSDVLVIIDEAYREFVTDPDAPDGIELSRHYGNVATLRTFSKAYGLAGLRVGYAVAPEAVGEALRKVCIPFSVNALAQIAALASLDAQHELKVRCDEVTSERQRVYQELVSMGYEVPPTQANFVWIPLRERTDAFDRHCQDGGVIVRAFSPDGVRVTIGNHEENDAFLAAARSFPR